MESTKNTLKGTKSSVFQRKGSMKTKILLEIMPMMMINEFLIDLLLYLYISLILMKLTINVSLLYILFLLLVYLKVIFNCYWNKLRYLFLFLLLCTKTTKFMQPVPLISCWLRNFLFLSILRLSQIY